MKKYTLIFQLVILLFLIGCANKSYYHSTIPAFESLRLWTGVILILELIIGLGLSARISGEAFGRGIGGVIGSALGALGFGYLIFGEWGIRISEWILGSTVGTVILAILNFVGGIFGLFSSTIAIWVMNGFHWHSPEIAKYVIVPAIVGGAIQLFLIAKADD